MTIGQITQIIKEMMTMSFILGGPIMIAGMVVGVLVSIVQAVLQVQEQSVSFIVKIVVSAVILLVTSPWMLGKIMDFSVNYLGNLDKFVR